MKLDRFSPGPVRQGTTTPENGEIAVWMASRADRVAGLLKALSHEGRLMILCHLSGGEKSVTELEDLLNLRQAAVSQQLARLRLEGLVATRREGKAIFYSIHDMRVQALLQDLRQLLADSA